MLELLVAIAIIGVLAGIGMSSYRGYVASAQKAALIAAMESMRPFQEDTLIRTGAYGAGKLDRSDPDSPVTTLVESTGWRPPNSDRNVYLVSVNGRTYTVTARSKTGAEVTKTFP